MFLWERVPFRSTGEVPLASGLAPSCFHPLNILLRTWSQFRLPWLQRPYSWTPFRTRSLGGLYVNAQKLLLLKCSPWTWTPTQTACSLYQTFLQLIPTASVSLKDFIFTPKCCHMFTPLALSQKHPIYYELLICWYSCVYLQFLLTSSPPHVYRCACTLCMTILNNTFNWEELQHIGCSLYTHTLDAFEE